MISYSALSASAFAGFSALGALPCLTGVSNMIICLPNEVVLELHTPESLASVFGLTQ